MVAQRNARGRAQKNGGKHSHFWVFLIHLGKGFLLIKIFSCANIGKSRKYILPKSRHNVMI